MQYSTTDHAVWSLLYKRQYAVVHTVACESFITGLATLQLQEEEISSFETINARLLPVTGWQVYPVPGLIPNAEFFGKLYQRRFGATSWLRKMEELDYLEEPDMFHDVFGHIPLLTDALITTYLHQLAGIAVQYMDNEYVIEAIARLYWYTIEFGLIREKGELKIYGSGILSSTGETKFCLSEDATHIPFDLERIIDTSYIKDDYQPQYFVLDSFEQLTAAVANLENFICHVD